MIRNFAADESITAKRENLALFVALEAFAVD
jgi:hypothetical protein